MLAVASAVVSEIGADRTGIRLSPVTPASGVSCSDPQPQFDHIVVGLDALGLVYIHVVEGAISGRPPSRLTSRLIVEAERFKLRAIVRNDSRACSPREISSRSAGDSVWRDLTRAGGRKPPVRANNG